MKSFLLMLTVVGVAACFAQDGAFRHNPVSLKPNGYFRAENGLFALSGHTLCSHTSSKAGNETKCYALQGEDWKPTSMDETNINENYLDFGPCDPLNQLNVGVQHSGFASLLPRFAVIKQVIKGEHIAFIAYSDTPSERVKYSLRIAAMNKAGGKWAIAAEAPVGNDGAFCGMRLIDEQNSKVVLVYLDEVAGSANYSAIRSFHASW